MIDADEHPKPNTTIDDLARLRPMVVYRRDRHGRKRIRGERWCRSIAAGVEGSCSSIWADTPLPSGDRCGSWGSSRIMGIGPVPAIRKILARQSLTMGDIGVIELNEAFASQALACTRSLGLDDEDHRVNPNGGAIALGHPLGMSGARITGSAAIELAQGTGRYAIVSMCVGVGQGSALLLERV